MWLHYRKLTLTGFTSKSAQLLRGQIENKLSSQQIGINEEQNERIKKDTNQHTNMSAKEKIRPTKQQKRNKNKSVCDGEVKRSPYDILICGGK